jgi:hypothetical protein
MSEQSLIGSQTNGSANGSTPESDWDAKIQKLNGELKQAKYLAGFHGDALIGVCRLDIATTTLMLTNTRMLPDLESSGGPTSAVFSPFSTFLPSKMF